MKVLKVIGVAVILLFGALLILPTLLKDKVKETVVTEVSGMLNASLYLEDFSLGFFSNFPHATLSMENFGVVGVDSFANDTLVNVEKLNVVINLKSLFADSYEINKIELIRPSAHAIVLANGQVNWDIMKSDSTEVNTDEEETSSSLQLNLQKVTVEDLNATYSSMQDSMQASIAGVDLNLKGDLALDLETLANIEELKVIVDNIAYQDQSSSDMSALLENVSLDFNGKVSDRVSLLKTILSVDSTSFSMGGVPYLTKASVKANVGLEADLDSSKFTFAENSLSLNEITANFAGFVHLVDSTTTDMDLTLSTPTIDFKQILSLIPAIYANDFASIQTSGKVALNAVAKGRLQGDTLPMIDANLQIADAMFKYPDLPSSLNNINIEANISNPGAATDSTVVRVPNFGFTMAGNPFAASLVLKTPVSDPDFAVTADGTIDLGSINQVIHLDDMNLKGVLTAALKANGKMSYVDQEKYDLFSIAGDLNLKDFVLNTSSLNFDVNINKANLGFTSQYVDMNADLALGKSDLSLSGKVQNFIQYLMRDETIKGSLNVTSKMIDTNELLGVSEETEAQEETLVEDSTASSSSVAIPSNIDFDLNVAIDELIYDAIHLKNIQGNLNTREAVANIKSLNATTMGGTIKVNGLYDTKDTLNPMVDVDMNVSDMNIGEVFTSVKTANKLVPLLSDAEGKFSMSMHFASKMDATLSPVLNTVNAKGKFSSKEVSLKNVKAFNALAEKTKLDIFSKPKLKDINVSFAVKDGRLYADPFQTSVSSAILNVSGSSGLDQTLDYVTKIQLPQNITTAIDLAFDMIVGGTFTNPKISFSASSIKEQVKEKVKEVVDEAKQKAIAEATEQKAKLVKTATEQKEKMVESAKTAAEKAIKKAQAQSDSIVAKTTNPLAKAAAKKSGEAMVKKAKAEAEKMVSDAETKGNKIVSEAEKQGDVLIQKASEK